MEKLGRVLLGLGAFLLVTAALVKFYMVPSVTKTPLDVNSTTVLSGSGVKLGKELEVVATSISQVDAKKSTSDTAVFVNQTCAVDVSTNSSTECVSDKDPRLVSLSVENFATDRVTGLAVENSKLIPAGSPPYSGLINKWPFDTQKKNYMYWDGTLGEAVEVAYEGTEKVSGTTLYKFQESVEDAPIQVAEGVPGEYSMEKTLWIEPVTGQIINQQQHDVRVLDDGTPALDLTLEFTPEQQKKNLDKAKADASQLNLISGPVPLGALILGILSLVGGAFLVRRRRDTD